MKRNLGVVRHFALVAFALMSLGAPASAQPLATSCHSCGSCTCCDEGGEANCFIDCPQGYCDCCGAVEECTGSNCS